MAASDEALNRDRGALNPLPLGRTSNGVSGKSARSVPQNGHQVKMTDWLQKIYRIISE
jgi:hypothetical protein